MKAVPVYMGNAPNDGQGRRNRSRSAITAFSIDSGRVGGVVDLPILSRAEPEARRVSKEISMTCPLAGDHLGRGAGVRRRRIRVRASRQRPPPAPPPPPPAPKAASRRRRPRSRSASSVTLTPKTIIYMKGNGSWDNALETLQDAFKSVYALSRQAGHPAGRPADDDLHRVRRHQLQFQAAVPIAEAPKDPPQGRHRGRPDRRPARR